MKELTLKELIGKATPGPWKTTNTDLHGRDYGQPIAVVGPRYPVCWHGTPGCFMQPFDAQLIARANPATLLAVYEALEEAHAITKNSHAIGADEATARIESALNLLSK